MTKPVNPRKPGFVLPKLCGADIELGNFILGIDRPGGTGYEASHALLAEIHGYPGASRGYFGNLWSSACRTSCRSDLTYPAGYSAAGYGVYDPQDSGRRFLASNGGCAYIDLNHLELCIPEVLSAYDHVAAWHGMLRIAKDALSRANQDRPEAHRFHVLVNNTDGLGASSYGSHLNFLISRRTYNNIFLRKAHYLQFLASFQASAILLTGQGKVGAENGRPYTPYQISQRADYFEVLQGIQTTANRPIVNTRDEALCGPQKPIDANAPARLHVIFFDSALAHGSALFRVGPMQLILTLIEYGLVNARLILEDPLVAVRTYSRDPSLRSRARLIGGERISAIDLQCAYLEEVKHHAARGLFEGIVPRAQEIIALWEDTLIKLANGDLMVLSSRLDWVMKLAAIERAMEQNPGLEWESPETKMIDHMYSSLGSDGLYWCYEASGLTEQLVTNEQIEHFAANPPWDTRAWTRAMLLRRAALEEVEVDAVNWDRITFRVRGPHGWMVRRTVNLENPLGFTQDATEALFDGSRSFSELLDRLGAVSGAGQSIRLVIN